MYTALEGSCSEEVHVGDSQLIGITVLCKLDSLEPLAFPLPSPHALGEGGGGRRRRGLVPIDCALG